MLAASGAGLPMAAKGFIGGGGWRQFAPDLAGSPEGFTLYPECERDVDR